MDSVRLFCVIFFSSGVSCCCDIIFFLRYLWIASDATHTCSLLIVGQVKKLSLPDTVSVLTSKMGAFQRHSWQYSQVNEMPTQNSRCVQSKSSFHGWREGRCHDVSCLQARQLFWYAQRIFSQFYVLLTLSVLPFCFLYLLLNNITISLIW